MPRALVITVGTGRNRVDVATSIARNSIKVLNPDHILLLCTTLSAKETVPHLKEALPATWHERFEEPVCVDAADDLDRLFEHYREAVLSFMKRRRLAPEDTYADFTSGTKPMSSALVLVAVALGLGRLNYIAGERDREGRTMTGTERTMPIFPRRILYDQRLREFQQTFDLHQYGAAREILLPLRGEGTHEHQRTVEVLLHLNDFYAAWDRYDFDGAVKAKKALDDLEAPHEVLPPNIWSVYKKQRDLPGRMQSAPFDWMRLVDLLENARRRMGLHLYDDATARLYRAIEFLAQARLYHAHDIKTGDVDLDRVPENCREALLSHRNERSGKIQIPMLRAYELLAALQDDLGLTFMERYRDKKGTLQKYLNRRNESILAHGFVSVDRETAGALIEHLVELTRVVYPKLEETAQSVRFPRFSTAP
ncbi:MAG: TIGR02710 family CRISPR-associated protein [Bacteroidetes bacterium]|nr:MAG: TIGR02710 family CRISPR-associated protein [Bacteroidota bacterium]